MPIIIIVLMFAAALFSFTTQETNAKFKWNLPKQINYLVIILQLIDLVRGVSFSIIIPDSYSALDGDLFIQVLHNNLARQSSSYLLNLFRLNEIPTDENEKHFLKRIKLAPDIINNNVTNVKIGCQYFLYGGRYQLQLVDKLDDNNSTQELNIIRNLRVAWIIPQLNISSKSIPTYPDEPLQAELVFPTGKCSKRNLLKAEKPQYWLEVLYCGQNTMCNANTSNYHTLYKEEVMHLQTKVLFNISCDLFGLAGEYAIQVRPMNSTLILAQEIVQADWNEKFVFNVVSSSIFPCDPFDGIGALFEYPTCIEFKIKDRIRLYGRIQANITSLNPPTSLEYITEHFIQENKHSANFDCEYFSERHIEYCFTYVTQAIFGAVAEIRVDCVPTFPLTVMDNGGWGPWSEWTPCSTTCNGGTRHRYRFCDSPPPRYGASFCQGHAVETQSCGQNSTDRWECLYGASGAEIIDASTNNSIALDDTALSKCQCGCLAEFTAAKEVKVFASTTSTCSDSKLTWVLKATSRPRIQIIIDYVALPCFMQYLRIRDGPFMASELIGEFSGKTLNKTQLINSTGPNMTIELVSELAGKNDELASRNNCNGRFLARAIQIGPENDTSLIRVTRPQTSQLSFGHILAIAFAAVVITTTCILIIHFLISYKKYEIAINTEYYSPNHTPHTSTRSLINPDDASPPSRAVSTTTLISEVVYLVKMRRKSDKNDKNDKKDKSNIKHRILRESTISEKSHYACERTKQDKRKSSNLNSGSSQSTQTLYKAVTNATNITDSISIASFPCYRSSFDSTEIEESKDATTPTYSAECNSERSKIKTSNQASLDKNNSYISLPAKDVEADCASSNGSNATLTSGCYSAAICTINTATIRATNQKECKEKQNLKKLLSRPQSEFSLENPEDFELDYYDYNVLNNATVPGSYLGMDPAYLVWIPPLENSQETAETDLDTIMPRHDFIDTGSNKESPSPVAEGALSPTPSLLATRKRIEDSCHITKNLYHGVVGDEDGSPKIVLNRNCNLLNNLETKFRENSDCEENEEKETTVTKSPIRDLQSFYDADDIQFVDD